MLFFFYGTLMDRELRSALAGAKAGRLRATPGVLLNHRRLRASFGNYPVVVPRMGGRVPGLFVEGLDHDLLLWIAHFEGPEYLPQRVPARDEVGQRLSPWAFMAPAGGRATSASWDFRRWQRLEKPRVRRLMRNWLLESAPGRPLALDVSWRGRRRLNEIAVLGNDQPRPNPHLSACGEGEKEAPGLCSARTLSIVARAA